ncbi:hypothetical protein BIU90_13205 [Curtobacterium sp. MCBA15_001]|nr:hypothetical protein BIU90_13205 [Curtobacterium sp. MCBA15_001]
MLIASAVTLAVGTAAMPSRAFAVTEAKNLQDLDKSMPEAGPTQIGRSRVAATGAWGGYSNGEIPLSAMTAVPAQVGQPYLRPDAAVAFFAVSRAYESRFGSAVSLTEAYRDLARQKALYAVYQNGGTLAAVPGTSVHGWGQACDFGGGIQTPGSVQKLWMNANAPAFGWQPRGDSFSSPEAWHFEYDGSYEPGGSGAASPAVAFATNTGELWTWAGAPGTLGFGTGTKLGVAANTSPAVRTFGDTSAVAINSTNGSLYTWSGRAGTLGFGADAKVGVRPGTSPSIVRMPNGQYAVAFQATDGGLWTWVGAPGTVGFAAPARVGMKDKTSPSITVVGAKAVVAFQANTGALWTWTGDPGTTGGATSTTEGMAAGTSPAITAIGSKAAVAFNSGGNLWTWSGTPATIGGGSSTKLGMWPGSSPSMTTVGSNAAVAFRASGGGGLYTWSGQPDTVGFGASTKLGMKDGTVPSITTVGTNVAVAFEADSGSLYTWSGAPATTGFGADSRLGMYPVGGPSIG